MLQVIGALNQARQMELDVIHNYMQLHYVLGNENLGELAKQMKLIAIDEMRHAEKFAERIRELGGRPVVGFDYREIPPLISAATYNANKDRESTTIVNYENLSNFCRTLGDTKSAELFDKINEEEHEHLKYFIAIHDNLNELGNTYLEKFVNTNSSIGSDRGFIISDSAIV